MSEDASLRLLRTAREIALVLDSGGFRHAWCGAVGMALHGAPRASVDADLVAAPETVDAIRDALAGLGYTHEPGEITVADGRVRIRRFVRIIEGADPDVLDILLAERGSDCERALEDVEVKQTTAGDRFTVLGLSAFAELKSISARARDQEDAEILRAMLRLRS